MKKIFYVLAVAVSMVFMSCSNASQIEIIVAASATECPIVVDEITKCVDITTEDNNVVYKYVVDELKGDVNVSDMDNSEVKKILKAGHVADLKIQKKDKDFAEFMKLCKEANYNIVYRYTGNPSNDHIDIVIYSYEL